MIAYIFDKYTLEIESKITNVTSVKVGEINGDSFARFGSGSDYIILQNDTINLNKYDIINLEGLEDARDYFLKGSDFWYQSKLHSQHLNVQELNTTIDSLVDMIIQITLS